MSDLDRSGSKPRRPTDGLSPQSQRAVALLERTPEATKKKGKKGSKKTSDDPGLLGTSKAVETMFRNAIRAELDIIALAATKANIMISLNGFIISALMISGAFLFNSSPSFLIPAGVFILTSAGSITFALLAASPERAHAWDSIKQWRADRSAGQARLRDLRDYLLRGRNTPNDGSQLNLLIYGDRVQVSQEDFWGEMKSLLRDRDEIYRQMSDQLYWLGQMANRKFKLLNVSYAIFRWGLVASITVFLVIKATVWAFPSLTNHNGPVPNLGILEFSGIYEPSAVQQLPDGRLLVVEDEASRAMNILTIGADGRLVEDDAADLRLTRSFGRTISDLEGLSVDDDGYVYAITSHSGTKDGSRAPEREQLLRFQVKANQAGQINAYTDLRAVLEADAGLAEALAAAAGEKVDFADLNIEGLTYHKATKHLLLGLRAPLAGDRSIVISIENPAEVFGGDAAPRFGTPALLDLRGGGIRALSYDPVLSAFIIVNEIDDESGSKVSQMWSWNGDPATAPEAMALPALINLTNVESVDSIVVGDEHRLLIMSDEGDPEANLPAKYLMLDYEQLPGR